MPGILPFGPVELRAEPINEFAWESGLIKCRNPCPAQCRHLCGRGPPGHQHPGPLRHTLQLARRVVPRRHQQPPDRPQRLEHPVEDRHPRLLVAQRRTGGAQPLRRQRERHQALPPHLLERRKLSAKIPSDLPNGVWQIARNPSLHLTPQQSHPLNVGAGGRRFSGYPSLEISVQGPVDFPGIPDL